MSVRICANPIPERDRCQTGVGPVTKIFENLALISCHFQAFAQAAEKSFVTVKSERGLHPPGKPGGFLAGQQALHFGGSELPVGPLKPVRRIPYVEEVGGKNLELVPQHLVECG